MTDQDILDAARKACGFSTEIEYPHRLYLGQDQVIALCRDIERQTIERCADFMRTAEIESETCFGGLRWTVKGGQFSGHLQTAISEGIRGLMKGD